MKLTKMLAGAPVDHKFHSRPTCEFEFVLWMALPSIPLPPFIFVVLSMSFPECLTGNAGKMAVNLDCHQIFMGRLQTSQATPISAGYTHVHSPQSLMSFADFLVMQFFVETNKDNHVNF